MTKPVLPIRPVQLQTLMSSTALECSPRHSQHMRLYRRFLRLAPFVTPSRLQPVYKSLLKLRFQQNYNERLKALLPGQSDSYSRDQLLTKAINTLTYVNSILTYTTPDPVHLQFFQNYLKVHLSKEDFYKTFERKDQLVRNSFEGMDVLSGSNRRYAELDLESYRDFERCVILLNESEKTCL